MGTRIVALAATAAAAIALAILIFGGGGGYEVKARFLNGGQLVSGNPVQLGGAPIGSVKGVAITDDGQAEVTLAIGEDHAPLPEGTRAEIQQLSQSGIANRFVELTLPQAQNRKLPDGATIGTDRTRTNVELDQLFNTLDPDTRVALQDFFKNQARQFRDAGDEARAGFRYLNPSLSATSRLFNELTRDTPALERFLVDSSRLVTTLAERRTELAALVGNANRTTRALGNQKEALADAIGLLPPFMRRANSTFVNLRAALDDLDPLIEASGPAAAQLGPFLAAARTFAEGAGPTVKDLSVTISRPGRSNDAIELLQAFPPLHDIATVTRDRTYAPGGRRFDVGETRGALPETAAAFANAGPTIGLLRPYTTDFLGWFDDFSTTGGGFDALGAYARGQLSMAESVHCTLPATPCPVKFQQYQRCPGAAEAPAPDGSNVLSEEERARLKCDEEDRAVTG
ncbi:MAG TPA: MlaD family protein [Thermoleophilaceae bacterium]|nr:MlaD family protein [Thermoleophilaceae bacterium]